MLFFCLCCSKLRFGRANESLLEIAHTLWARNGLHCAKESFYVIPNTYVFCEIEREKEPFLIDARMCSKNNKNWEFTCGSHCAYWEENHRYFIYINVYVCLGKQSAWSNRPNPLERLYAKTGEQRHFDCLRNSSTAAGLSHNAGVFYCILCVHLLLFLIIKCDPDVFENTSGKWIATCARTDSKSQCFKIPNATNPFEFLTTNHWSYQFHRIINCHTLRFKICCFFFSSKQKSLGFSNTHIVSISYKYSMRRRLN